MVNYACAFSQSEQGKYFELIRMHLICPPPPAKFCIRIVFNFYGDGCNTRGEMKNKGYANLGGQIRCIMGDVQVANGDDFSFSCK